MWTSRDQIRLAAEIVRTIRLRDGRSEPTPELTEEELHEARMWTRATGLARIGGEVGELVERLVDELQRPLGPKKVKKGKNPGA